MDAADWMLALAAVLLFAWVWRNVWIDDREREDTATPEAWRDGRLLLDRWKGNGRRR